MRAVVLGLLAAVVVATMLVGGCRDDTGTVGTDSSLILEVAVTADGFVPLLKLVEVATGAPLAEWEERHSEEDALTYTIAGPGIYEARVYGLEGGTGTYTLTVRVNP